MKMTGYELLKLAFEIDGEQANAFEACLVDWDKAQTLTDELDMMDADIWRIFFYVGFVPERVLSLVDPAIRQIIERMLNLPMLTLDSCSGHIVDGRSDMDRMPYIYMIFKHRSPGHRLISHLERLFQKSQSIDFSARGGSVQCIGMLGPRLSLDTCLENSIPVYLSWQIKDDKPETLLELWKLVARALDDFDNKGRFNGTIEQFEQHGDYIIYKEWEKQLANLP